MAKTTSYSWGRVVYSRGPFDFNMLNTFGGVMGPSISLATGAALAAKLKRTDGVTMISFGDGTASRGEFHEAVNLAAVLKLPVVYVCQNNQYSISTPSKKGLACRSVADRALGYGIPGLEVDGNDVLAIHEAVQEGVRRARQGKGPSLIEARTYRIRGHFAWDQALYRPAEEVEEWKRRDPIARLQEKLMKSGLLTIENIDRIQKALEEEISLAMKEAEVDPSPGEKELGMGDIFAPAKEREARQ